MKQELLVGCVVRLKSGGPSMTVSKLLPGVGENVVCAWFTDGGSLLQHASFTEGSLMLRVKGDGHEPSRS